METTELINGILSAGLIALIGLNIRIYFWTQKLHDWHNKTDEDGVPVWYVRKSFEETVRSLGSTLEALNSNMMVMTQILRTMRQDVDNVRREISEIKKD